MLVPNKDMKYQNCHCHCILKKPIEMMPCVVWNICKFFLCRWVNEESDNKWPWVLTIPCSIKKAENKGTFTTVQYRQHVTILDASILESVSVRAHFNPRFRYSCLFLQFRFDHFFRPAHCQTSVA